MASRATRRTERPFPSANGYAMIVLALGSLALGIVGLAAVRGAGPLQSFAQVLLVALGVFMLVVPCSYRDTHAIVNAGPLYS